MTPAAKALIEHVEAMFAEAKAKGLYLGAGYDDTLPASKQEGPMVKKLRALVKAAKKEKAK